MGKLNAKAVENAPLQNKEYKLSDGDGLYLRVRPSGAKSWLFCYRLPGDRGIFRMTLGSLADVSLKEARGKIVELRKLVAEGIDPRAARAATKAQNSKAITMQVLFDTWIEFVKRVEEVTPTWAKRHEDRWRLHLKKPLANILAKDITRSHLAVALEGMAKKGIREETRKALTTLNLVLDYGVTRHFIESNPSRVLKPKDFAATANRPRSRVLTLQELHQLWRALDEVTEIRSRLSAHNTMSVVTTTAIKLLVLTGARRGEVAAMRWGELDLENGIWTLSSERTKNRQGHTIFLSSLAIDLLQDLKRITGNSPYVFDTGRQIGLRGHIHADTLTAAIARLREAAVCKEREQPGPLVNIESFSIHDLRRSAATAWGEYLKTPPHIVERMLNHQPLNKLVATYQHALYLNEQKAAWNRWGEMIDNICVNDSNNIKYLKLKVV